MTAPAPARLLVPVDFSDASAAALRQAALLAERVGARIVVMHSEAIDVPPYFTQEQLHTLEREVQQAREEAERALFQFARPLAGEDVEVRIEPTNAIDAVLEASRQVDLVIMGTHGRRGPKRWWLGSVAERVVRETRVPVLVVHSQSLQHTGGPLAVASLGEGSDVASVRAWAEALASWLSAPLRDFSSLQACSAAPLPNGALVVVSMPADPAERAVHKLLVSLGRTCQASVLFVPAGVAPTALRPLSKQGRVPGD